jgi:peptidyl-prolyl cis-trans isomerase SDCCAG10
LKANDFQVNEDDKPLYPPKIISTEILANPFEDIVPRPKAEPKKVVEQKTDTKKQKK